VLLPRLHVADQDRRDVVVREADPLVGSSAEGMSNERKRTRRHSKVNTCQREIDFGLGGISLGASQHPVGVNRPSEPCLSTQVHGGAEPEANRQPYLLPSRDEVHRELGELVRSPGLIACMPMRTDRATKPRPIGTAGTSDGQGSRRRLLGRSHLRRAWAKTA
jgi:hypothetical protein